MFPARYFAKRYFAGRYFLPSGMHTPIVFPISILLSDQVLYSSVLSDQALYLSVLSDQAFLSCEMSVL